MVEGRRLHGGAVSAGLSKTLWAYPSEARRFGANFMADQLSLPLAVVYQMPEHEAQGFFVAAETGHHRSEHGIRLKILKGERIPGLFGQDVQESQLRAPVPIPERMDGIEFREESCCLPDESLARKSSQESL